MAEGEVPHAPLVYALARRLPIPSGEREDVIQAGFLGLSLAVKRFDPTRGVCFSTYAVPLILGEMRQQLRRARSVHVGRQAAETAARVLRCQDTLAKALGRQPTLSEVAREAGLPPVEAADCLERLRPAASLEAEREDGSLLQVTDGRDLERETLTRLAVREALETLPARERTLLALRYTLEETQGRVGDRLGLTQVQVSRLEKKALAALRARLEEK